MYICVYTYINSPCGAGLSHSLTSLALKSALAGLFVRPGHAH